MVSRGQYEARCAEFPGRFCDYPVRYGGYYEVDPDTGAETWVESETMLHPDFSYCVEDTYWYAYFTDEDGDPVRRTGGAASGAAAEAPEMGPPKETAAEAEDEVAQAGVDAREQREQRAQVDEQGEQL